MSDYSKYKVFVLGAGLGTRLRPLTDAVPKVMVPIYKDRPLLEHEILLLKGQGFTDFIVNLHYLPEKITGYFGNGERFGVSIEYSDESEKLMETAGAIKKAGESLSDDFIFIYGDELYFFDFKALIDAHERNKAFATIVLKRSDNPQAGEIAEIDPVTKKILKWSARPHDIHEFRENAYVNAGLYVFSKKILDFIPDNTPLRLDIQVLPELIARGEKIYGFPTDENILDIGTPEKYEFAKQWYLTKLKESPFHEE
jgi:mannose-1-phosphate guanylyltransferase/mannose-1-phosphate guanylyltransferase/phosphomannomutase